MKIIFFFFILFFSIASFAFEICIGSGCPTDDYQCIYNEETGYNVCLPVNSDGTVNNTNNSVVCSTVDGVESCVNVAPPAQAGVWNPKTFSCSNYVSPVADSSGNITCPAVSGAITPNSKVDPNPSKDDVACGGVIPAGVYDPIAIKCSNGVQPVLSGGYMSCPAPSNTNGCASQETAIKTNALISESNANLSTIASSEASSANILSSIAGILRGIASQGSPPGASPDDCPPGSDLAGPCGTGTGTGTGSGTGSGSGSGSSDSLLSEDKTVNSISVTSSQGSCPSAESFNVLNKNYQFSYQPLCDLASSMRGLVVAIGAFSALLIVVTAL